MEKQKNKTRRSAGWGNKLNQSQRDAVNEIRSPFLGSHNRVTTESFMVYMQPSTGKAKLLELRRYSGSTHKLLQVWKIELDGTYIEIDLASRLGAA